MTADTTLTRERRKRRVLGLLAGAAGGLLLMGGTTFALWTASTTQDGGTITAGTFDLDPVDSPAYYDTSSDRIDVTTGLDPVTGNDAHTIEDLVTYRIVPGDTLQANYKFLATLTGDNLVAEVRAALPDTTGTSTVVTMTAQPYYWDGAAWASAGAAVTIPLETTATVTLGTFQAPSTGQDAGTATGTLPVLDATENDAGANLVIVLTATFPNTTGTTDVEATSVLNDLTVSINQVRDNDDS